MKNSLALGMSREYAVIRLILPVCAVELLGTVALGMAYGMGAVAPNFVYGCGYGRRCSGKTYGSIYVIAVSSVYAGK